MKYLILIYGNPASRAVWEGLSEAQRAEGLKAYAALNEDLAASGEMVVAEALADPSLAKRVSVREGRTVTSDGPFAEAKEHLAGFFLIDVESRERAEQIVTKFVGPGETVELRPVMVSGGPDQ